MNNKENVNTFLRLITEMNKVDKGRSIQENLKGERYLMLYLKQHGGTASPGEICASLGVTNARIAAITKSLERKGYIVRIPDKIDRRRIAISMTEAGKERVDRKGKEIEKAVASVFEQLGEKDTSELLRIMGRAVDILEK